MNKNEAKIIAITNQKGGCGKTTISMNIAATVCKLNPKLKVLVVDGDKQGSGSKWSSQAKEVKPFPATLISLANSTPHKEIKKIVHDFDIIVIDCPPAIESDFTASALLVADLAIVPVKPTPIDVWATVGIKKVINSAMTINESLQYRILISMAQSNSMTKDIIQLLDENFPDVFLESFKIAQRTVYTQAALIGGSVHDFKDEKASLEMVVVVKHILKLLNVEYKDVKR